MEIIQSDISSPEVLGLFSQLDDFMIDFLGEDKIYYTKYNINEGLDAAWIAYSNGLPVGCTAFRSKLPGTGEVKRMFVKEDHRGFGISKLLSAVEEHAGNCGIHTLLLSTRLTLVPAISLYRSFGFVETFRKDLYVRMEKRL